MLDSHRQCIPQLKIPVIPVRGCGSAALFSRARIDIHRLFVYILFTRRNSGVNNLDELLIRRAAGGDSAAFEQIESSIRRLIWGVCWHYMGSMEDTKDAYQDSLVRIWSSLAQYEPSGPFEAWAYHVASTTCLNLISARKARKRGGDLTRVDLPEYMEPADPKADVEKQVIEKDDRERLRQCLLKLPEDQRNAVTLIHLQRRSYQEAAQILGIETGTLKSRVSRGIRRLTELMNAPNG